MGLPWISSIGAILFVMFIGNAMWTMSQLFMKLECSSVPCYQSFLAKQPKMQLALFTSTKSNPISSETKKLLNIHNFNYFESFNKELEVEVPLRTRRNGTLHMQVVFALDGPPIEWKTLKRDGPTVIHSVSLTEYMAPKAETFNLLSESETIPVKEPTKKSKRLAADAATTKKPIVTHITTKAPVAILTDFITLSQEDVPPELAHLIRVNRHGEILPIIKSDFFNTRLKDLVEVTKNMTEFTVSFEYKPISIGKLRLMLLVEHATKSMLTLGFTNKDLDDVKKMFSDTNAVLLSATLLVGCVHLLFDFLSFKNDVVFWRRKKSYEGLSTRTTLWRAFSQLVIFFYLMDENTSLLVVIPAGIGAFIELWKCKKILKLEFNIKGVRKITTEVDGKEEKKTEEFDREAMRYLSYLLYPLCIAGAAYSLIYQPHKSWYSWTLNSLVNGVYAFDFLFMLPQLFVNYKLKSVAALPWRSFMYKAFNTFIDDLFAFIITMPTAHRLACFRDDVVFVIYLYQRWLYPVDKNRIDNGAAIEQIPANEQPDEATEALLDSDKKNK